MMDNHIQDEVAEHMYFYTAEHAGYAALEKLRQERQEAGEEREFSDISLLDDRLRRRYERQGTPQDRRIILLEQICAAVNRNTNSIPLEELKATLTEMVRKQYDATFEGMITSPDDSISDRAVQLTKEDFIEGCDGLLKGELERMLDRIKVREGKYYLKKEE